MMLLNLRFAGLLLYLLPYDVHAERQQPLFAQHGSGGNAITFCLRIAESYPQITFFPGDTDYQTQQNSYFSVFQTQLRPACRITPTCEEDLRDVFLATKELSAPFAIRAGGHSWNTGFSNIDASGVTIDLSMLNKIELDMGRRSVKLGAGLRWEQVYSYLEPHGVTVPGGRDSGVGVSGFLLGGGISWHANHVGWSMDTLLSARVLLASGDLVTASPAENQELFWAIKGSVGLMGIVTEFELPVFDQGELYGGYLSFNTEQVYALADAVVSLVSDESAHPDSVAYFAGGLVGTRGRVGWSAIMAHTNGSSSSLPMQRLEALPHMGENLRVWNLTSFTRDMDKANPTGLRQTKSTFTYRMCRQTTKTLIREFDHFVRDVILDSPESSIAVTFQPLTAMHLSQSPSMFGLHSESQEPLMLFALEARWISPDADETFNIQKLHEKLESIAGSALIPFQYPNYANAQWQDPIRMYSFSSVRRLCNAVQNYDPQGIFSDPTLGLKKGGWSIDTGSMC